MEKFIIFYATSKFYDSVVVEAESLKGASATADAFALRTGAIIVGIISQSVYIELHPHE